MRGSTPCWRHGARAPLVAMPIRYDQPGVAARIAPHGAGRFPELDGLTADWLREDFLDVLETWNTASEPAFNAP